MSNLETFAAHAVDNIILLSSRSVSELSLIQLVLHIVLEPIKSQVTQAVKSVFTRCNIPLFFLELGGRFLSKYGTCVEMARTELESRFL